MDFLMINSISNYIKSIGMQNKWQQKKKSGDFTPDETLNEKQRLNDQFKKSYMEQKENDTTDEVLASIHTKIQMGSKLTADEMKYLQSKDPTSYQKLKSLEAEKKQYEHELKKCRTKEDVQKMKMSKVASSLTAINSVKNNPNIPDGAKLEVAMHEQTRLSAMNKITDKFVKSGEYANLPTEAERYKAEKDLKEAEEAEKIKVVKNDSDPDKKNEVDKADSDSIKNDDNEYKIDDNAKPIKANIKNESAGEEHTLTRVEAEQTSEAQKLKRSKAKSAYIKSIPETLNEPYISVKG